MKTMKCACGLPIYVDDEDLARFEGLSIGCEGNRIYVTVNREKVSVSQVIISVDLPLIVDHKDRNVHNNQRSNLRIATRTQNNANRIATSKWGYKGIFRNGRLWTARVMKNGVHHHMGSYRHMEDAARAYDRGAVELFGEFAKLNFPNEGRAV